MILLSWVLFWGYWFWRALTTRTGVGKSRWRRWSLLTRFVLLGIALLYFSFLRKHYRAFRPFNMSDTATGMLGAFVCMLGLGVAIWARIHIGDNWGMPMTQHEAPELVTGGPYAYVRHPIYTGMLLALFGTMLAVNSKLLILWPVVLAYLGFCAIKEEEDMKRVFPAQYSAYMRRTKRLIPFVW